MGSEPGETKRLGGLKEIDLESWWAEGRWSSLRGETRSREAEEEKLRESRV